MLPGEDDIATRDEKNGYTDWSSLGAENVFAFAESVPTTTPPSSSTGGTRDTVTAIT